MEGKKVEQDKCNLYLILFLKKREICGKNNSIKVIKVDSIFIFFFLIL